LFKILIKKLRGSKYKRTFDKKKISYELEDLNDIFINNIHESNLSIPIDINGDIKVNFFLNLLNAVHDDTNLDILANIFSKFILEKYPSKDFDGIVCPKIGNILLCNKVSKILNTKRGFIKHSMMFNKWLEGNIVSGNKVLLIDDLSAEGEILSESIKALNACGVHVVGVLVFVNRKEGDAIINLEKNKVNFHYYFHFSDDDLKNIKYKIETVASLNIKNTSLNNLEI